jgi:putative glutathione S-transferase
MGVLIDGVWTDGELPQEYGDGGRFKRAESRFRDCITADGSSGFKAEPGRYHLYVAHGCPWAHRTLIYRALKKLDGLIGRLKATRQLAFIGVVVSLLAAGKADQVRQRWAY